MTAMGPPKDEELDRRRPILRDKNHLAPAVFTPDALLRGRRQKGSADGAVPEICILARWRHRSPSRGGRADASTPVLGLLSHRPAARHEHDGVTCGMVAAGASFLVLVAEELFASGCRPLISLRSASHIQPERAQPYFIVIDLAFRDLGASYPLSAAREL